MLFSSPSASCSWIVARKQPIQPRSSCCQMIRCQVGIALHHRTGSPPTQVLQLMGRCSSLPLPGRPGVPQVVPAEVLNPRPLPGCMPGARVGRVQGLALVGEHPGGVPAQLTLQDAHGRGIQWHSYGLAVLRLPPLYPGMALLKVDLVPLQPEHVALPQSRCQGGGQTVRQWYPALEASGQQVAGHCFAGSGNGWQAATEESAPGPPREKQRPTKTGGQCQRLSFWWQVISSCAKCSWSARLPDKFRLSELPTAGLCSSHATPPAVDNSVPPIGQKQSTTVECATLYRAKV